jgi:hypothetical protein
MRYVIALVNAYNTIGIGLLRLRHLTRSMKRNAVSARKPKPHSSVRKRKSKRHGVVLNRHNASAKKLRLRGTAPQRRPKPHGAMRKRSAAGGRKPQELHSVALHRRNNEESKAKHSDVILKRNGARESSRKTRISKPLQKVV